MPQDPTISPNVNILDFMYDAMMIMVLFQSRELEQPIRAKRWKGSQETLK